MEREGERPRTDPKDLCGSADQHRGVTIIDIDKETCRIFKGVDAFVPRRK
jgi:hypothetical protein